MKYKVTKHGEEHHAEVNKLAEKISLICDGENRNLVIEAMVRNLVHGFLQREHDVNQAMDDMEEFVHKTADVIRLLDNVTVET